MADGKGRRWKEHMGIPKHLVNVDGETIISRTVRLLKEAVNSGELEIIVTSHDRRYEFEGCIRYEPMNNVFEIDRFTEELIEDNMCFLYGDTYYTRNSIDSILKSKTKDILFFGNKKSIVAIKIKDSALFRTHVKRVKNLYLEGKIDKCIGWQVYQSITGQDFRKKIVTEYKFETVDEDTKDLNEPGDYWEIKKK